MKEKLHIVCVPGGNGLGNTKNKSPQAVMIEMLKVILISNGQTQRLLSSFNWNNYFP